MSKPLAVQRESPSLPVSLSSLFSLSFYVSVYVLHTNEVWMKINPGPPGRERSSERFKGLLIIVTWAVARKRVGGRMTDLFDRVQARLQCAGNCCRTLQLFSHCREWDPVQTHVQVLLTPRPVCSGCFNNLPLHTHFYRAVTVHFFVGLFWILNIFLRFSDMNYNNTIQKPFQRYYIMRANVKSS